MLPLDTLGNKNPPAPWAFGRAGHISLPFYHHPSLPFDYLYHAPLSTLSTLHSPVLEFHSLSFLFPMALGVEELTRGGGGQITYFRRGGV